MYLYAIGFGGMATSSRAQNDLVEESPSLLAFDRKRAQSYPSERSSEPIALLELPRQPQPIKEEEENEVNSFYKLDGYSAQFGMSSVLEHKFL